MGSFVSKKPVEVKVDDRPDEYILIRPKLGVGASGDLTDSLLTISGGGGDEAEVKVHAGRYNVALLKAGVVGWQILGGPDGDLPVDAEGYVLFKHELIDLLDPEDALVDAALAELIRRNPTLGRKPKPSASA